MSLPTKEEYEKMIKFFNTSWSEPKYQCPNCDGGMCRNETFILASNPPKYEYRCNKCHHIEWQLR